MNLYYSNEVGIAINKHVTKTSTIGKTTSIQSWKKNEITDAFAKTIAGKGQYRVVAQITPDGVIFKKKKSYRESCAYNGIFIVEQLLLSNDMPIIVIIAQYKVL